MTSLIGVPAVAVTVGIYLAILVCVYFAAWWAGDIERLKSGGSR